MKRMLRLTGGLLGVLALAGLVVALVMTFQGLRGEPQAESPVFQSPIETPTPNKPAQTPSPLPPVPTSTPGKSTPLPSPIIVPTLIIPTPPTPIPGAPGISKERAIEIALSQNPRFREMQKDGLLKITAKLTVHGDIASGATGDLRFSPNLPVWIIYLHLPPWTEKRGPAEKEVVVKFSAERFEIDATTGKVIGGGRSDIDDNMLPDITPEVTP